MAKFTASVVQMRSGVDVAANVASFDELVRAAAAQGAQYVQTPEMTGLVQSDRNAFFEAIQPQRDDAIVVAASRLAHELSIHLHVGSTPVKVADGMAANRALLYGPDGKLIDTYDKIHMFDVDLDNDESWRESAVYRPGEEAVLVDVLGTKLAMAICYDVRFPELHTTYARAGAEVLTGPSCFTRQTGKAHWHTLLRSRAIETGSFMIAAAQGGEHEDGRTTYGHSLIVDPWGEIIAEVPGEEPGIALAEIDTDKVIQARSKVPNLVNNRAYSLRHSGSPGGLERVA